MQVHQEPFREFHQKNPQVYKLFRDIALELIESGDKHIGSKMIFEVIRYKTKIRKDARKHGELKLNNNYTPDYARQFCQEFPQHHDKFEFREVKGTVRRRSFRTSLFD